MEMSIPAITEIVRELTSGATPALFHCSAGKDRTGVLAAVLLGLLVPLVSLRLSRSLIALGAVVLAWCLVVAYMSFIPDLINPQPVVSDAVGQAAWYGTPYVGPQIAAACAAATLLGRLDNSRLKHLFAAHLSAHNNRPDLARAALAGALNCAPDWIGIADQREGFGWREFVS
jgi:hypothetical protein